MGILVEVRIIQRKEERKGWREGKKRETEGKLSQKGDAQTWRASISLLYSQSASLLIHLTPSSPSASKTFLIFRCEKSIEKWAPDPWFRCFCMSTCHIFLVWVFFFSGLLCCRRLLRVPWTARGSNQSILKEIGPGCSLEGLMLKLKLQYFGHLMWRVDSLKKTLLLGGIGGRRRRGR